MYMHRRETGWRTVDDNIAIELLVSSLGSDTLLVEHVHLADDPLDLSGFDLVAHLIVENLETQEEAK